MTNEDLRIVRDVLRESARLSNSDADALTAEIARRCGNASPRNRGLSVEPTVAAPTVCQVEHSHWEGPMICGNPLPCPRHGGR